MKLALILQCSVYASLFSVAVGGNGGFETCAEQQNCLKAEVTQKTLDFCSDLPEPPECEYEICIKLDLTSNTNCEKSGTISHVCLKDTDQCPDTSFADASEVGALASGAVWCQIVAPNDFAEFLMKDGSNAGCSSLSGSLPSITGGDPVPVTCDGTEAILDDPNKAISCTGNRPDKECVWTVQAPPTCGTTTTTTTTQPSVTDDPHFLTWNNTYYDFMGACDLKLITAPFFAPDLALDIDIRTTIRYQYSYIESAVVKIGENTLEVTSFGGYMLDGVSSATLPSTLAGFAVKHSQPSKHVHLFEIILSDDGDEKILVKTFKDMVSVKLSGAKLERFHGSQGMLGSYDKHGLMLARDGATILEDGDAFAAEWQIRDSEPMVFQTVRAPQFPEACQLPTMTQEESRRRLAESSITMEAAEEACASWPKETISGCIHDVLATGDLELAAAGAF